MSFLIFAARKLQLKRQMNDLSFRNMQLSQQQQTVAKQIANAQKSINSAKNAVNYMGSISNAVSVFNQSLNQKNATAEIEKAKADGQAIDEKAIMKKYGVTDASSTISTAANVAGNVMNSIFDAAGQVELTRLNAKDSQINLEMESNESQLTAISAEYQNVKKSEGEEAKNSAPTFGLA